MMNTIVHRLKAVGAITLISIPADFLLQIARIAWAVPLLSLPLTRLLLGLRVVSLASPENRRTAPESERFNYPPDKLGNASDEGRTNTGLWSSWL